MTNSTLPNNHHKLIAKKYKLSAEERERVEDIDSREFSEAQTTTMATLYGIVGHKVEAALQIKIAVENLDEEEEEEKSRLRNDNKTWASYSKQVGLRALALGLQSNIDIIPNQGDVFIPEKGVYCKTRYKIIIQNLLIDVSGFSEDAIDNMVFHPPTDSSVGEGIYLVFENNNFVGQYPYARLPFQTKDNAYLLFKNNKFTSVDMHVGISDTSPNASKIEFENNVFEDSDLSVVKSIPSSVSDITSLKDNIFYCKGNKFSRLSVSSICYLNGKNTVDNLALGAKLHWNGRQNIDPQEKQAHIHKYLFIRHMKAATQDNDKMQEVKLRKEWLKCENILLREEKIQWVLQDRIILWWIAGISDYGTQWLRPIAALFVVNFVLSFVFCLLTETNSSLGYVFGEFFNPFSSLGGSLAVEGNGWVSFFNAVQKVFFAAVVYESLKIFRRFSTKEENDTPPPSK